MASGRKDFLSQAAPENYVAGLGRGATGFTTRSDLGPAREGPTPEQIQAALTKRAQLLGAAAPTAYGATTREKGGKEEDKEEEDERFQDPDNEVGLFAYGQFDQEDDEADRIYQEVDEKMDKRRRARRLVISLPFPPLKPCVYRVSPGLNRIPT
jgi:pre-mRNA-processing factor 6